MDMGEREQEIFQWVLGFSFNIIDNVLMLPVGVGGRHSKNYRLFFIGSDYYPYTSHTYWIPETSTDHWDSNFLFEIGLSFNPIKWISLLATYRLVGFHESSYTLGTCFTWPK